MCFDVHSRMVSKFGRFLFTEVFYDLEIPCTSIEEVVLCYSSPSHAIQTSHSFFQLVMKRSMISALIPEFFHRRLLAEELDLLDC